MNRVVKAPDREEAAICGLHLDTKKSENNVHSLENKSPKLSITECNMLSQCNNTQLNNLEG